MKPLVSILIPAYNAEAYISQTLKSALAQTWERKEIIVVDDGSTDRTVSIARQFDAKNVNVVVQANQGAVAARNKAFELCQGDYIQWLDADDLLNSSKISKQVEALQRTGTVRTLASCGWAYFFFRATKAKFCPTALWTDLSPVEWMERKWEQHLFMQTGTWLASRELTQAAGPWDERLRGSSDDDGEYFSRIILTSDKVIFVPEARVYYRMSGTGSLAYIGNAAQKKRLRFLSMQMQIDRLRAIEDGPRARRACLKYLQSSMILFYPEMPDLVEECRRLAASLGGSLQPPYLAWKYAWIRGLFGWEMAKKSDMLCNRWKAAALRLWDRVHFSMRTEALPE
jgi:glycosyltransferase involved in cell wall biosynthesis